MENIQSKNRSSFLVLLMVIGWIIALVFVLTTFLFWQQNQKLRVSLFYSGDLQKDNEALQNQLTVEKDQLSRCVNTEAVIIEKKTEPYTFQNFGLYSPLFENQDVLTLTYDYMGNSITQRQIAPAEHDILDWSVSVWEVLPPNNLEYLDSLKFGSTRNFPIFDGYEFQLSNPQYLEDRIGVWDEKNKFVNTNDLGLNPGFSYEPKSITGVKYEFINQFSATGNPSFVVINKNLDDYARQSTDAAVLSAREELNQIVNTINFRLPAIE